MGVTVYPPDEIMETIALSDETTDLATGTAVYSFRAPAQMVLTRPPRISCNVAPTGSPILVDMNVAGSTVLSPKVGIPITTTTSVGTPTAATGSIEITGGTASPGENQIASAIVDGVLIIGEAVNWVTSNNATATALAAAINAYTSIPSYTAVAVGAVVTITSVTLGASVNGFVVSSVLNGDVTVVNTNMANGVDAPVLSTQAVADNAIVSFDIDQIGSGTKGKGLKINLYWKRARLL